MKKIFVFLVICIFLLSFGYFLSRKTYYFVIPVTFDEFDQPMISAQIDNEVVPLKVDLGSRFQLFLSSKVLNNIEKKIKGETEWHSSDGTKHSGSSYIIPKLKIGDVEVANLVGINNERMSSLGGFLGSDFNLFLDFPHSQVIASDSFEKLPYVKDHKWKSFPFEILPKCIAIRVNSKIGPLYLGITSCSTYNILRPEVASSKSSFWLDLDGTEFRNCNFYPMTLPLQCEKVDGYLGMDFLKDHPIYFDVKKKLAYIQTPEDYFEYIPLTYGDSGSVSFDVVLENLAYSLLFDTGRSIAMDLNKQDLSKIQKDESGIVYAQDYSGKEYKHAVYVIPEFKIGNLVYKNIPIQGQNEDFHLNTQFGGEPKIPLGSVGSGIFLKYNFLLDFSHSCMYACNDCETLKQKGLLSNNLHVVPFELIDNSILVEVETDEGLKQLMLDTGATYTTINRYLSQFTNLFRINGYDFGKQYVASLEFAPEWPCDGTLGAEFMHDNVIYIDYCKQLLYIDLDRQFNSF